MNKNFLYEATGSPKAFWFIVGFSVLVRLLVGLGGYSGENDPPNYGDFEAQRNWMSLTYHRPAHSWYHEPLPQPWWRLDYPPIAGHVSYAFAKLMKIFAPEGLAVQQGF